MADVGHLGTPPLTPLTGTGNWKRRTKGVYTFAVAGTFGGTSAALEMKGPDGSTAIAIANTAFTAAGAVNVELTDGEYRAALTGGSSISLHASLKEAGWQGM